jgi:hypothetical protein
VYYIALRDATDSQVIRRLCQQILRDEDEHVRFQCERLAILRRNHGALRVVLKQFFQRVFFGGTCLVFWWKHAPVMRAGGFGFFSFRRMALEKFRVAARLMDPRRYRFGVDVVPGRGAADRRCVKEKDTSQQATFSPVAKEKTETLDLGGKWLEL